MRIDIENIEDAYDKCISSGNIRDVQKDLVAIRSLKNLAQGSLEFIKEVTKKFSTESTNWTFIFIDQFHSLQNLIESYLLFGGISSDSCQSRNAVICLKHQELELDWEFLETVRLMRNAINYQGKVLKYEDWKDLKLKFDLHISLLKAEIEKLLSKAEPSDYQE